MDINKTIASGILELYVAGSLSEAENREIAALAAEHPQIREEIEAIESGIRSLASAYAPDSGRPFSELLTRIDATGDTATGPRLRSWRGWAVSGWAAALLIGAGAVYFYLQTRQLDAALQQVTQENITLEEQIADARNSRQASEALLETLRAREIEVVPLAGQQVAPESFAKVYWNRNDGRVYVDASGLPEPPPGMVYQVWSLKLDPLTPTSLGLLDAYADDADKVFALANPQASEAFGITLEPAGGSTTPTLEQLYTLGSVST